MERKDELEAQVRKTSLRERLDECRTRIGKMCSEGRPPRMCIPVQWDDDDFYISTTLADAQRALDALQAQLRQAEGQSQQQAEEAVIVFAKYTTLRQLLEDVLHTFGYLRFHRVAGMDGLLYETHNKMSPERTVEACEKRIRATLAAQDAGKVSTSIIGKQVPPSQWDKNAEVRGDIS